MATVGLSLKDIPMAKFSILLFLGACSGAPFTGESGTPPNEAGAPTAQGGSTEAGRAGMGQAQGGGPSAGGMGATAGQAEAGGAGIANVAGASGFGYSPASCLAGFESRPCANACNGHEETGCAYVLTCFRANDTDSIDKCPGFTQTAYSIAQAALKECCK